MKAEKLIRLDNASEFYIKTPMGKLLHNTLEQWIWCGLTGGVIIGESRYGKTMAIMRFDDVITARNGEGIPVFRVSLGDRDYKTIRSVFAKVGISLGFKIKKSHNADDIAFKVKTFLAEASLINETHQVILIVDEAQLLSIEQLSVFAEIYNDLFDLRHNCAIFFVANENRFSTLAKELIKDENTYLRERFFNHVHHFYSLRNAKEVRACLEEYDRFVIRASDQCKVLEYFCPTLYQSGWRLSKVAVIMWQIYYEKYMIPFKHNSWSMSQFVRTTNILIMDYLPHYETQLDDELLESLIIRSLEAAKINPSILEYAK